MMCTHKIYNKGGKGLKKQLKSRFYAKPNLKILLFSKKYIFTDILTESIDFAQEDPFALEPAKIQEEGGSYL